MAKRTVAGGLGDPTLRFATLEIRDKKYRLAYSFNAIAKAEMACGVNLLSGGLMFDNISANQFRGLFYAALSVADPDVTVEQAGDLISLDTMPAITAALIEAYGASMPPSESPTEAGAAAQG